MAKKYSEEDLIKKTKRRLRELYYGDKTYMPKTEKAKKNKKYFDKERRKLRKKQSEINALLKASDKAYEKRKPFRKKLGMKE